MRMSKLLLSLVILDLTSTLAFVPHPQQHQLGVLRESRSPPRRPTATAATTTSGDRAAVKKELLGLLRVKEPSKDPVLADPVTKEALMVESTNTLMGGDILRSVINYQLISPTAQYAGSTATFLNLLEPVLANATTTSASSDPSGATTTTSSTFVQDYLLPLIPPPLRSALATAGVPVGDNYVPMRDLFTSPAVSYAYERGWRQGFASAGFPGAEREAALAMEYFAPCMSDSSTRVLVDMSCATGLFTRRFAASGNYKRVLGCDYSASMLEEARRRIQADRTLQKMIADNGTVLDLVRLDVGRIPMQDGSVDALHAGAAMHCWPDLPAAVHEIYRVLQPRTGRYFATTFLSSYFGTLQRSEGGATGPSRQAFQYFKSIEQLRSLMESAGFERDKIFIEILGNACVVIRCEK